MFKCDNCGLRPDELVDPSDSVTGFSCRRCTGTAFPQILKCSRCEKELLSDADIHGFENFNGAGDAAFDNPICWTCYNAEQEREDESYRLWVEGKLWG